jgi:Asp-tRNA(Asn)/Glu-tRNA(Gln) amidotransferase C subunit
MILLNRSSRLASSLPVIIWRSVFSRTSIPYTYSTLLARESRREDKSTSENTGTDIEDILKTPTWSVKALLPATSEAIGPQITSKQLNHLLRLSALPLPSSKEEEIGMLKTLQSQLHFVREIQSVDTAGLQPLSTIRDETKAAQEEQTVTMDKLKEALAQEETVGIHFRRIRRRAREEKEEDDAESWDVLGYADKKAGKYFIVEKEK